MLYSYADSHSNETIYSQLFQTRKIGLLTGGADTQTTQFYQNMQNLVYIQCFQFKKKNIHGSKSIRVRTFLTTISHASMIQNIFQISESTLRFSRSRGGGKIHKLFKDQICQSAHIITLLVSRGFLSLGLYVGPLSRCFP